VRARPTTLTVSPLFAVIVLTLGFVLGTVLALWGYGVPVAGFALTLTGLVQLSEDERRRSADRIREALRLADIGIRQAARIMEMDPADFERALTGERKLDLWRLEMLPASYWQEFWPLLARDKGNPASFRTFAQILPVFGLKESA
jgi:hypothetical protein